MGGFLRSVRYPTNPIQSIAVETGVSGGIIYEDFQVSQANGRLESIITTDIAHDVLPALSLWACRVFHVQDRKINTT